MALKLFSNILAYRHSNAFDLHKDLEAINQALASKRARLPGKMELNAVGFTEPVGEEGSFIERISPMAYVFAFNLAERMIPGKIVRQQVAARVKKIEKEQERKVYAREKQQIKDEVLNKMLPQAFIDQKITYGMVLGPYVLIDSSSAKRGEDILCTLRECIGSMPVRPVAVTTTPIDAFTRWFTGTDDPVRFSLTGDFKANARTDESDFVNGKGTSPKDEGLSDLVLEHDRRVTLLGLNWATSTGESASFTVNEMIGIKGIKWPESLSEMAADQVGEEDDEDARRVTLLRTTLILLGAELKTLLADLLDALGGEQLPEGTEDADENLAALTLRRVGEDYFTRFKATLVESDPAESEGTDQEDDDLSDQLPDEEDETYDYGALKEPLYGTLQDPLYGDALDFVRESGRASISAIQRKLKIGYNRAARMIETLEENGIVTPMNSNGGREVIRASSKVNQAAAPDQDELV